jgi:hypothetical protein
MEFLGFQEQRCYVFICRVCYLVRFRRHLYNNISLHFKLTCYLRSDALLAVKFTVLWYLTSCSVVECCQLFYSENAGSKLLWNVDNILAYSNVTCHKMVIFILLSLGQSVNFIMYIYICVCSVNKIYAVLCVELFYQWFLFKQVLEWTFNIVCDLNKSIYMEREVGIINCL